MTAPALATAVVYQRMVGARVRAQLQYRTSFVLDLLGAFLVSFGDFVVIWVLFGHMTALEGWSFTEVAFLYGCAGLAFGLCEAVVGHLDKLHLSIKSGEFDVMLIRPVGSLFQVISSDFSPKRIGQVFQAGIVLAFAISRVSIDWTVGRAVMIPVMVVSGACIFAAVWIVGAATTFWTVDTMEITNSFTYGGSLMTSYPATVFGPWLRRFITFVVPLAFVAYVPALYVLDKPDPFGLPGVFRVVSPLVALASLAVASWFWRLAVRHYRSTGS